MRGLFGYRAVTGQHEMENTTNPGRRMSAGVKCESGLLLQPETPLAHYSQTFF